MVSVIMPVYNVKPYLQRAVESFLNQTYRDFELILVDDGSGDGSGELCDLLAQTDGRIRVVHRKNGGLSEARNSGIAVAAGEFICFPDSDDYVEKNMLEKAVLSMNKGFDLAVWGYYTEYEDNSEKKETVPEQAEILNGENSMKSVPGCIGYAWNKLYKREIIVKNSLRFAAGVSLIEDIIFNSDYIAFCRGVVFIDKPFNHYLQRANPTLGTRFYPNAFELKMRSLNAWENIVTELNFKKSIADSFIDEYKFSTAAFYIRMVARQKNISLPEKRKLISGYLKNGEVMSLVKSCRVYSKKNKLLLTLIKLRAAAALALILS